MNIHERVKRIWKDPVISKIIANILWNNMSWLLTTILFVVGYCIKPIKQIFLLNIPVFYLIVLLIVLLIIVSLYKMKQKKLDAKIIEKNIEIVQLQKRLTELTKTPHSRRYKLFNNGDIIKRKMDNCFNNSEYTVIGKTENNIIVLDKENNQIELSPDALNTVEEYLKEKEAFRLSMRRY